MCPGICERHVHLTRHCGRPESDFCVYKLKTPTRTGQRNVERFAIEFVDYRSAAAPHDARDIHRCGSEFRVRLETNGQEQGLTKLRAGRRENGEKIAQWFAGLA